MTLVKQLGESPLCTSCIHHLEKTVPNPQTNTPVTFHMCDALKGLRSLVNGEPLSTMECGTMRLSSLCQLEGLLFEAIPNKN